jgi:enterochelin esterase family protein
MIRRHTFALFVSALAVGLAVDVPGFAIGATPRQGPAAGPPQNPAGQPVPGARGGGRGGAPVRSPEVGADRRVTFRLRAPNAKEAAVTLSGKRLDMIKDDQGVWSVTSDALAPDIYTYSMSLDGTTISDPSNRQFQTSFGSFQTMFVVPGPMAWLPASGVPRGAIARHAFHSNIANDDRDFFVYTPPGYDARRSQPYPVLYILHGLGDDAERWVGAGAAHVILDNLIAAKKAVPMVMVSPLGYGTSQGPAGGRGHDNVLGYQRILLDEVMPVVDRAYNVSKDRNDRAIAGLSMGGAEALYVGLNNLDRFAWISSFSGALLLLPGTQVVPAPAAGASAEATAGRGGGRGGAPQLLDAATFAKAFPKLDANANSQIRLLWIVCGTADGLIGQHRQLRDWLKSKDVRFTEQEVPEMGHVWPLWRQNLTDLAPRLFQQRK